MKTFIELHIIQNLAPNNINRDDTGSPKDAYFGGTRRARVSSQSFKRAMRQHFAHNSLLSPTDLAIRTTRAHEEIARELVAAGKEKTLAEKVAKNAMAALVKPNDKTGNSSYLVFLGRNEIKRAAESIISDWDAFETQVAQQEASDGKSKKKGKGFDLDTPVVNRLERVLDGKRALDLALFGRMLADLPERNVDAAAQVAHALGTHALRSREYDFFTAVDDLKADDNAGAGMLGTVEFGSATLYRYMCIDLGKLAENLGDHDLLIRGVQAFVEAAVYALPTGKQNSFAAHNLPALVAVSVRSHAPRSLANAFEAGVQGKNGFLAPSIDALATEWEKQERYFGAANASHYIDTTDEKDHPCLGNKATSVKELIERVAEEIKTLLESNTTQ